MNLLPLDQWAWIVVNSSAGKDSQTALRKVVEMCDAAGYPRSQIVVSHQCLGRMEWPGTLELVYKQAAAYGLRVEVTSQRNKKGEPVTLLDYIRRRGKWPSNKQRFCTSDFKRGPGLRVITKLGKERPGNVLQIFGFRAEESTSRRKKKVFHKNDRGHSSTREIWNYLPIHDWTEKQVWEDIRASGVPYHPAYDKGMPRLSCCLCIFAPRGALIIAGKENPELLDEYVTAEKEMGHTFRENQSLADIKAAVDAGEQPQGLDGKWNM